MDEGDKQEAPAPQEAGRKRERRAGSGQVLPRGEGRWLIRVFIGMGPSTRKYRGKPIEGLVQKYRSQVVRGTKKDAERVLRDLLRNQDQGVTIEPTRDTLDTYLTRWLETSVRKSRRWNTAEEYEALLRRYVRGRIGARQLAKLTPLEIQAVYSEMLGEKLSARTVRYVHAVLHSALKQAVKWRLLATNPADSVDLPKQEREEFQILSDEQCRRLLDLAKGTREYALFALALASAMRPSELLGLQWSAIDGTNIRVVRTLSRRGKDWRFADVKRKRSRRAIEIDPETMRILREHKAAQAAERLAAGEKWVDQGLMFPDHCGAPERNRTIVDRFKRLLKRGELPDVRLYDLRHTGISLMLMRGINPLVVSRRAGHASVAFTLDVYGHLLPGQDADAATAMGSLLYR